jgi:hypothetical protein
MTKTYAKFNTLGIFFIINKVLGEILLHQLFSFIFHISGNKSGEIKSRVTIELD